MIVSKHALFDKVEGGLQYAEAIREMRNLESGSLCFVDPSGARLDYVTSGV